MQTTQLVRVFNDIYNLVDMSNHVSTLLESVVMNTTNTQQNTSSAAALAIFSLYNNSLSANEKVQCVGAAASQTSILSVACQQNLSIEWPDNSCIEITALNARMNQRTVRAFIFSKSTPEMLLHTRW